MSSCIRVEEEVLAYVQGRVGEHVRDLVLDVSRSIPMSSCIRVEECVSGVYRCPHVSESRSVSRDRSRMESENAGEYIEERVLVYVQGRVGEHVRDLVLDVS